ncbi:hypothetical protein PSH54_01860 [Pseudoalteromonas sp. Angola-30]|uniref:hypothetical protein n=1 Tax=Pseudoalteromonas sp. Angola-30 TaxID=3025341 RepID=UPI002358E546|nr:hypothetical protein [Pseudoalteromonas sp. Angola-30]MDC9524251.1 hypothetical protein [Pseudoalteromonas sp. Angola-30]
MDAKHGLIIAKRKNEGRKAQADLERKKKDLALKEEANKISSRNTFLALGALVISFASLLLSIVALLKNG